MRAPDPRLLALVDLPVRGARSLARPGLTTSTRPGNGSSIRSSRGYEPGDDPRHVDWNATARTGELQVRTFHADVALTLTLLPSFAPTMRFATAARKWDTAAGVAGFLAALAARRNERTRLDMPDRNVLLPLRDPVLVTARLLADPPSWDGGEDLAGRIRSLPTPHGPSLLVVIADLFLGDDALDALTAVTYVRDLAVVIVSDPTEVELPNAGRIRLTDPTTGRSRTVDTSDPAVRTRFATASQTRRLALRQRLRSAGAHVLEFTTGEEVCAAMLRELPARS